MAFRAARRLDLSPKEFALLECLLATPGLVLPAEELLERVWDEAADPFTSAVKHGPPLLPRRPLQARLTLFYATGIFVAGIVVLVVVAVPLAGVQSAHRARSSASGAITEHLTRAVTAGDPRLIENLIANLVDNAIRHNHRDGHVEITTRTSGTQVTLTVTNSGPVIPGHQIQRLFQPFQRLAPDRNGRDGYGLGLAIVNTVTQAHHATLSTRARPAGGLSVTVELAASPEPGRGT